MFLQLELVLLAVAVAVLVLLIFWFTRRQPPPPLLEEEGVRYTPGEREIITRLSELKERIDKMIPPYGRVGYIPSTLEEIKDLLGFSYVRLGEKEIGERPPFIDRFKDLDVDFLQAKVGSTYVYIVQRSGKRLIAAGDQFLDYLTVRFLFEFLDYI